MPYKFFSIRALDGHGEAELNQFLSSQRIVSVEREFVADGLNSQWVFCVSCLEGVRGSQLAKGTPVDYREVLNEKDFAVFARLRDLRKELAEKEGVPPYALFNNEQLAEMVRKKIGSRKALGEIKGVGPGRVEKYAEAFLAILAESDGRKANQEAKPD